MQLSTSRCSLVHTPKEEQYTTDIKKPLSCQLRICKWFHSIHILVNRWTNLKVSACSIILIKSNGTKDNPLPEVLENQIFLTPPHALWTDLPLDVYCQLVHIIIHTFKLHWVQVKTARTWFSLCDDTSKVTKCTATRIFMNQKLPRLDQAESGLKTTSWKALVLPGNLHQFCIQGCPLLIWSLPLCIGLINGLP